MAAQKRVLAMHGYELMVCEGYLAPGAHNEAIRKATADRKDYYDVFFLLGGGPQYVSTAIDIEMKRLLVDSGIAADRILVSDDVPHLKGSPQPLDTVAEVWKLKRLQSEGEWREMHYDVICIEQWRLRIEMILDACDVRFRNVIGAKAPVPPKQACLELALRLLSMSDPLGDRLLMRTARSYVHKKRSTVITM